MGNGWCDLRCTRTIMNAFDNFRFGYDNTFDQIETKNGQNNRKKKPQIKPKRLGFLIVYLCVFLWWFFGLCVATGRLLFGVNIANPSTSFSFIKINLKCSIVLIFHLLFYCCFCISAMAHRKIFVSFCVRGVLTGLALYVNQS